MNLMGVEVRLEEFRYSLNEVNAGEGARRAYAIDQALAWQQPLKHWLMTILATMTVLELHERVPSWRDPRQAALQRLLEQAFGKAPMATSGTRGVLLSHLPSSRGISWLGLPQGWENLCTG